MEQVADAYLQLIEIEVSNPAEHRGRFTLCKLKNLQGKIAFFRQQTTITLTIAVALTTLEVPVDKSLAYNNVIGIAVMFKYFHVITI